MGSYTTLTPINDSEKCDSLCYFQSRMYLATAWYGGGSGSQGIIGAYLYRANSAMSAWDQRLEIPQTVQPYSLSTIIFQNRLYITAGNGGNYLWRLNDTLDEVIEVVTTPTSDGNHDLLVYEDRLYACTQTGELIRLNLAGDAWETVCARLGYWGDPVLTMTAFNGSIYANMWNYGLVKVNATWNAWEVVVDWNLSHGSMNNMCVHNGRLYSSGYDFVPYVYNHRLYRLSIDQTAWEIACEMSSEALDNTMIVYNNMIYWGTGDSLRRLSASGDTEEDMLQSHMSQWVIATEIAGDRLYFSIEFQSQLFRYDTLVSVDFSSDKNSDLAPATVNFTFSGSTDFPLTSLLWTFNDGYTSSQATPSHTFIRGTYNITLSVSNGIETGSITKINFVDSYSNSVFNIDTVEKLQLIGSPGNALTSTPGFALHDSYVQTANIDASATASWNGGRGFIPIGLPRQNDYVWNSFSGTYDGSNYNITGLHVHTPLTSEELLYDFNTGLFAICNAATFTNINLVNVNMTNPNPGTSIGCIVCYGLVERTTVEDCHVSGNVTGYYVGGLVCNAYYFDFTDCSSEITITAQADSGGLISYSTNSTFIRCNSDCTITTVNGYTGGIGGAIFQSQVEDCHAIVDITTNYSAAGIIGALWSSSITNCSSEGTISGGSYCAGISGYTYLTANCTNTHSSCNITSTEGYSGGLFGYYNGQQYSLTNSYSTGNVTITRGGSSIGGFIGSLQNGDYISNCYATGNVLCVENSQCGGFAGYASAGLIENCYCTGNVTGGQYTAGFIGYNSNNSSRFIDCNCSGTVTCVSISPSFVGGFFGYCSVNVVRDCYTRSNVIVGDFAGYYAGGFVGYANLSDKMLRCGALGNVTASKMIYAAGFAGQTYNGIYVECFTFTNLTCSIGSGFASVSYSSFYNVFSQTDLSYHLRGNSKNQEGTECQTPTDFFCRYVINDSPTLFTMTNSVSGMNILWHENLDPLKTYQDSFGPYIYDKTEYRIFFDFTVKNCGDNTSVIEYTYRDWANVMVTGFQVKLYRQDYLALPEGVEIYAVHEGTSTLIFSQANSYNQKFSLICQKLGYVMNFYINNVLTATYELSSITDNAQNQVLVLGGNESGGIATEYEISKIAIETRFELFDTYIGGFAGVMNPSNFFSKCYSAGRILQI